MPGYSALKAGTSCGSQTTQALLNTPRRSTPLCRPLIWAMDWSSDSLLASTRRMAGSRLSAAAVMVTPALVRVNSGKPHSFSIPATAWLMAEGVRCSRSAVRAKLPSCAMVEKIWQASNVIKVLPPATENAGRHATGQAPIQREEDSSSV